MASWKLALSEPSRGWRAASARAREPGALRGQYDVPVDWTAAQRHTPTLVCELRPRDDAHGEAAGAARSRGRAPRGWRCAVDLARFAAFGGGTLRLWAPLRVVTAGDDDANGGEDLDEVCAAQWRAV